MKIIENETIPRKNGFTLKELIEGEVIYKNCTFMMDKDAEYCLQYRLENDSKSIINFLINCNFKCSEGSNTVGHSILTIEQPNYDDRIKKTDYLKRFPLNNITYTKGLSNRKYLIEDVGLFTSSECKKKDNKGTKFDYKFTPLVRGLIK